MIRPLALAVLCTALVAGCDCGRHEIQDGGTAGGGATGGGSVTGGGSATGGGGATGGGSAPGGGGATGGGTATGGGGATGGGTVDAGPPCGIPLSETTNATVYVTVDDEGDLYMNGQFIASQAVPWSSNALNRTIVVNRNPTVPNVVAVEARNVYAIGGVDRAALVDFRLGDAGISSAPRIFASDNTWRVLVSDGGSDFADGGWTRLDFDDSSWGTAVAEIPYGAGPYGNIFSGFNVDSSGASWVWAYDSAAAASKPTTETIYLRHIFYFTLDGGFSTDAGQCSN